VGHLRSKELLQFIAVANLPHRIKQLLTSYGEGIFQILLSAPSMQLPLLKLSGEKPAGFGRLLSLGGMLSHSVTSTSWGGCEMKTGLMRLSVMRGYSGVC